VAGSNPSQEDYKMCIFSKVKFQCYTEDSRLLGDYFQNDESDGQHWSRMQRERIERNTENANLNKESGKHLHIIHSSLPQLKAAENTQDYSC
jgi:hypothetical protein